MDRPVRSMHMDIVERRALGEGLYRVTIAASEKVRQPPELDFGGLSTLNYSKNPVVMWAHDSVGRSPSGGLPIGRTLNLAKGPDGQIVADFEFLEDDPFAQRVKNAWDKGFLRAASISWVPQETTPAEGGGWRDMRSDLLEWSIVSVPADPDALRESHRRMMDDFLRDGSSVAAVWGPKVVGGASPDSQGRPASTANREHRGLALSPDDYDDLTTALALLRDVVEGVHGSEQVCADEAGVGKEGRDASDSGLSEIREAVSAIRGALHVC